MRVPTSREMKRFVKRSWLRSFGPTRNDRSGNQRRWLLLGKHKLDMGEWRAAYVAYVDKALANACTIVVPNEAGRAIAWACYEPSEDSVRLYFLYVDPQHRGQGIAKALHERIARGRPVTYLHMTRREDS